MSPTFYFCGNDFYPSTWKYCAYIGLIQNDALELLVNLSELSDIRKPLLQHANFCTRKIALVRTILYPICLYLHSLSPFPSLTFHLFVIIIIS